MSAERDAPGDSARNGLDLVVEVDGSPWRRVPDLTGSGPDDEVFVLRRRDDGATVVEFGDGAHGRRPAPDGSLRVRYRTGGGYSSVQLVGGSIIVDARDGIVARTEACGMYRASVQNDADPLGQRRLLVRIPEISGSLAVWALACLSPGEVPQLPAVGDEVWVAFESCDPSHPVWLGRLG